MFSRSTWLHLRIPFSYFLMPVFIFALGISSNINEDRLFWVFIIVHLFLYPASNGYNSYFDKDEKSIGGLKNPPPVNKGLYTISLLMDGIAFVAGLLKVSTLFAIMLVVYGLVSKAYSHPSVRLKKYPFGGWVAAGLFQGLFTFLMCYAGLNNYGIENLLKAKVLIPGLLTSFMLWGNYPMTQVYQHEEDAKHGDQTLSMLLGIRGTFIFVLIVFGIAAAGFAAYFMSSYTVRLSYLFLAALSPVIFFFLTWMGRVWKDDSKADYANTMRLNLISATCLNGFFVYFFISTHIIN